MKHDAITTCPEFHPQTVSAEPQRDLTAQGIIADGRSMKTARPTQESNNAHVRANWNKGGDLFERDKERNMLLESFHRQKYGRREILLISGQSGTGKTVLAKTLKEPVATAGGFFVMGKFDQLQRPEPFAPIVAAFTEFVNLTLQQGPEKCESMKCRINNAIELEGRLLIDTIPALELILGPQRSFTPNVEGSDAQQQLGIVLRKFAQAICSPEFPLVLLIDDLQWADEGSLDLLEMLVTSPCRGLIVVGTCRNNEVSKETGFGSMLCRIEDNDTARICNIELHNMGEVSLYIWLSSCLHLSQEITRSLASFVYKQTKGNVFFVLELVSFMIEEAVVCLASDTQGMRWDDKKAEAIAGYDIVMLTFKKMERLPKNVKEVLRIAACIGAQFEKDLLTSLMPPVQVEEALHFAKERNLIRDDPSQSGWHRFTHDYIQRGAYTLIPNYKKSAFHLWLGRLMVEKLTITRIERCIFLIVNQLSLGGEHLQDSDEKDQVASLCLQAGEQATKSSAFVIAADCFMLGIELLGDQCWRDHYYLSLNLHNKAVEAAYCTANFNRMDNLIDEIILHAHSFFDKIRAYTTRVHSLGSTDRTPEALELGLDVLRRLGVPLPKKGRALYVMMEMRRTKKELEGKTDEWLLERPPMVDPVQLAAFHMLHILMVSAYFSRPDMVPFICTKMIQMTLRHGLSALSSIGFAFYGMMLCHDTFRDINEASRYGELAVSIIEKFQHKECIPRVYMMVYGFIKPWKESLQSILEPLQQGIQIGFDTGDVEMASLLICRHDGLCFFAGKNLSDLEKQARNTLDILISYEQSHAITQFIPLLQTIYSLAGYSERPSVLADTLVDDTAPLSMLPIMIAYIFDDYEYGEDLGHLHTRSFSLNHFEHTFYEGLIAAALAQEGKHRLKNMYKALRYLKKLKNIGMQCPENFSNKMSLLEAEVFMARGNVQQALLKFHESISMSILQSLLHDQALACERLALAYRHLGDEEKAKELLLQSCSLYSAWGAKAKVKHMEERYSIAFFDVKEP